MNGVLAVIAKAPAPGRVKTRLSPTFTPQQAASIAEAALRDTLATVRSTPAARHVLVLDGAPADWPELEGFEVLPQRGDGLAERLAAAFDDIAAPTFLIGMDTPQVRRHALAEGLAALTCADAVLGPSVDGGYWGIGLGTANADVFRDVPMSRSSTADAQRARFADLGLSSVELGLLDDVDTAATALRVGALAPSTRFAAAVRAARTAARATAA